MSENESNQRFPSRIELNTGNVIRIVIGFISIASTIVGLTSYVVKSSFPSDVAQHAADRSTANKIELDNLKDSFNNLNKVILSLNAEYRLTRLEAQQSQLLESQKDIKNSMDNLTNVLLNQRKK